MSQSLAEALKGLSDNGLLIVLIMSALPLIELRGAIPAASILGVNPWLAMIVAWGGAGIAVPAIIALLRPVLSRAKQSRILGKIFGKMEERFSYKADKKLSLKSSDIAKLIAIFCFVALPLPMTGVWSGSVIAAFSGLSFAKSIAAVLSGNLCAAALLTLICTYFNDYTAQILNAIMIVTLSMLIIVVLKGFAKSIIQNKNKSA
ncbi:MAG: small multi-drug export protein [Clostridia bacterium]|nr:small multi-drug export protein [Clostridia bacterium]